MNKQMLEEIRNAEKKALDTTLLVDIADNLYRTPYDKTYVDKQLHTVAEALDLKLVYMANLINPYTAPEKKPYALKAIRLSKVPHTTIIITDELHDVSSWVKTYSDKGIQTYVYMVDTDTFYEDTEYLGDLKNELLLDSIMRNRYSQDRAYLEDLAESFSMALGWTFSGPIKDLSITSDYFDKFKPYETMSYAGFKGSYSFANTVHSIGDSFIEDDVAPGSTNTIIPSRKSRLKSGKAVSTIELEQFKEYITALIQSDLLEESLEPGWIICKCGNPIRQTGSTYEDAFCDYCSRPIPDFEATTYDEIQYQAYQAALNTK